MPEHEPVALTDQLGTVRDLAICNAQTGVTTVANHKVYDSFGGLKSQTNASVDCLFGLAGRPTDIATGLENNWQRIYDPKTGRWLSKDPIGYAGGDANLTRYVSDSPTDATDPAGLYGVAGHFYTTFLVLRYLGYDVEHSYAIAYYSQLPDQITYTDALRQGVGHFADPANPFIRDSNRESRERWRKSVFNWLHSLHDGDNAAVLDRRSLLINLLKNNANLKDWVEGFLLHALADAYAHTVPEGRGRRGFGYPFGHLAKGALLDEIGAWTKGYRSYIRAIEAVYGGSFPARNAAIWYSLDTAIDSFSIKPDAERETMVLRALALKHGLPENFVPTDHHNTDPKMPPPSGADVWLLIHWIETAAQNPNTPPPDELCKWTRS